MKQLSWKACGLLILAISTALFADPNRSLSDVPPYDVEKKQLISDLEKRIADLQKELEMLRQREIVPPPHIVYPDIIPGAWTNAMKWRNIGPANMGGRITSLAVFEADPSTYFVATASGGLLKTTNNGTTFEFLFDHQTTVSIGVVAVSQTNRDIVWVGTGEANPRNSVSWGDGVYKSTDGGKTWANVGLKNTFQIADIVVHPTNPEIVYVAAMGRLYGPNPERGLFKTVDGGKTWNKVWFADDKTGVIDIALSPTDPETLIISAWERQRDEFDSFRGDSKKPEGSDDYAPAKLYSSTSGLYKTTDGGKTFKKLTNGLPTVKLGRSGLDWSRKTPGTIFAIIDSEKAGEGLPPSTAYLGIIGESVPEGAKLNTITENGPAAKAGLKVGDIVTAVDKKDVKNYEGLISAYRGKKPGDKITLAILRGKEKLEIVVTLGTRQGSAPVRGSLGVILEEVAGGLKITTVLDNTPAAKVGLKVDDVLTSVNGTPLNTLRVFTKLMENKKPGDKIKLSLRRGSDVKETEVTLEQVVPPVSGRPYSTGNLGGQRANVQDTQGPDSFQTGGVFKSTDGGENWTRVNSILERPFYFSVIRVDPTDDNNLYVLGVSLYHSTNGGKTFSSEKVNSGVHPDQHALWINPKDGRHMLIGTDGGFYVTWDRAAHWEHFDNLALGQFYHVTVDNRTPYNVYGGLQDNGSWGGPSQVLRTGTGPTNEDWIFVSGGDGFVCRVDPDNPDLVYAESQDGNMLRRNLKTGLTSTIRPRIPSRFNWNTPFLLSSHNSGIFYCAGSQVFRSTKQGDELKAISPEITRTKRGSATALAESPKNSDVLWVGTDDGAVQVTRDGGKTWSDLSESLKAAGLPGPRWVSSIEASRVVEGRAYVTFDAHRSDDLNPYVFVTENYGASWKSLRENLPVGSTRVIREDLYNPNLLWLGTEFAAWCSINRGASWNRINGETLPTVAVHEIAQPTTANELVVATHGRSIWILDITALRQLKPETLAGKAQLFAPSTVVRWTFKPSGNTPYSKPARKFVGENPPRGATLDYLVPQGATKVSLKITDVTGKTIRDLQVKNTAGFNRVQWDLRKTVAPRGVIGGGQTPSEVELMATPFGKAFFGPDIAPGTYRVVLNVDGTEYVQPLKVEGDPKVREGDGGSEEEEVPQRKEKPLPPMDDF